MKNTTTTTDMSKFEMYAKKVAEEFKTYMKENDFDSFQEMADCYWWTAKDIKSEVDETLRVVSNSEAYIDELDGTDVFVGGDCISYRKFSAMWRKYLK